MPAKINIQSSDKETFDVDIDVAKKSKTIRTMLEDLGIEKDDEEEIKEVLPLPKIRAISMKKVVDWCIQHKNDREAEIEVYDETNGGIRKRKKIRDLTAWEADCVRVPN